MTCIDCGEPTPRKRRCRECARLADQEERARADGGDDLLIEPEKTCQNCGDVVDEAAGDYLDDRPGVWMCYSCKPEGDRDE